MNMPLSPKYLDFLKTSAKVEFLEGTTSAGKTTIGVIKFMLKVAESPKKLHILSGLDLGTIEKNIINKDLGIKDVFGSLVEYNPRGRGENALPHIAFNGKIIYVLGYDNKSRWKKALGGQYGCLYIDEINIADMEYVRESSMRCDYLMGTLNPDDPNLPIYKEYINHSRPLKKWEKDTPTEILNALTEEPHTDWVHWFFSFRDNLGLTPEKIQQIKTNVPKGTKLYKNKILGLRGRATGLVFSNFTKDNIKNTEYFKSLKFKYFTCGVDTAYSQKSPDTIAMIFGGITDKGMFCVLDEEIYNNADLENPLAPSDVIRRLYDFLERNRKAWGFSRDVFIDSADQSTIMEAKKFKSKNGVIYNFMGAYKKTQIIDRIHLQLGWIAESDYLVCDICKNHIAELESYSWQDDKYLPEDFNDHTINAVQYAFLPFKAKIGSN
ncbi:MAG: terminase [Alphaproteobacteria bacterium]|nr:terminase [Alphaproteobacteria bacterium]